MAGIGRPDPAFALAFTPGGKRPDFLECPVVKPFTLLKCIGVAVLKAAAKAIPFGEVITDLAHDVYREWSKEKKADERRAELQAVAQAAAGEVRAQIQEIVQEIAGNQPTEIQETIKEYLHQVPSAIHQSLRRPSDPTGTTLPPSLQVLKEEDLIPFLPAKLPRFKPGDRPLPGVDWELTELLGVGGFGEVWKARNPHFDSVPPVALKFCLDPAAKDRLLRHEAAILNQVMRQGKHSGIVPLLRTYLSADAPCLEYEYVEGGDLGVFLTQRPPGARALSVEDATEVIYRLATIVGFAHRLTPPIVHRDLKPANVLLQKAPENKFHLRIADFGIGGLAAGREIDQTKRGIHSGLKTAAVRGAYTPLYASPQQIKGMLPDPRDDVHALGVIWYQLLTGDLNIFSLPADWQDEVRRRGLSDELFALLSSCLASRAEKRPAIATELAQRIKELQTKPLLRQSGRANPTASTKTLSGPPVCVVSQKGDGQSTNLPDWLHDVSSQANSFRYKKDESHLTENHNDNYQLALDYAKKAFAHVENAEYDLAILAFNKSIQLSPDASPVLVGRALVYHRKGEDDRAIADFNEAIRLDPNCAFAYLCRGKFYKERGWLHYAIADFSEAIRLDPNDAIAYRDRGFAYREKGEKNCAIADFTEAIRLAPNDPSGYRGRAAAYFDIHDYDGIIADISNVIHLSPKLDAGAYEARGDAYLRKSDYDRALADFNQAIRLKLNSAFAYHGAGEAYLAKGDFDLALTYLNEAIRLDPNSADTYALKGTALFDKGEYEEAITNFSEAIRLDPNCAYPYGMRGYAYRLQGYSTTAVNDLTEALRLDPSLSWAEEQLIIARHSQQ